MKEYKLLTPSLSGPPTATMPRLLPGHTPALPPMHISPVLVHTLDPDLLKDSNSTLPMFEFPAPNSTWHAVSISQMFVVESKNEWEDSK